MKNVLEVRIVGFRKPHQERKKHLSMPNVRVSAEAGALMGLLIPRDHLQNFQTDMIIKSNDRE